MSERASGRDPALDPPAIADRLHSAAIHLLRHVRRQDPATGLSAPRLSALSVIVFGGPVTVSDLAQAEQVQLPTISRLVKALEGQGLVRREVDPEDRRVVRIHATARGESVLDEGRTRRVRALSSQLEGLPPEDLAVLSRAAEIMEDLSAGGRS